MPKQKRERTPEEALFVQNHEQRRDMVEIMQTRVQRDQRRYERLMRNTYRSKGKSHG